jgi:hypothetical protein
MKKELMMRCLIFLIFLAISPPPAFPCTSAIISGRATPDGRPLLWKHRDSSCPRNAVRSFRGERYQFAGIVNVDSTVSKQIWIGTNEVGFSIMNTASYNLLSIQKYKGEMDREGIFMVEALGNCATVGDFEQMLDETNGDRGVQANFGVIDARGSAAYFETGPLDYMEYDVTDPTVAPWGYMVRTNFSFAGDSTGGYGYIRYRTISNLFWQEYMEEGAISVDFIVLEATRCLKHSLLQLDLYDHPLPVDRNDRKFIPLNDYIPRSSSVSSMVIQGVTPGEDPSLSVMWTIPGFPLVTPVFPYFTGLGNIPPLLMPDGKNTAPLNAHSLRLKKICFPIPRGSGNRYIDLAPLLNQEKTGILQRVIEVDRQTLAEAKDVLASLRKEGWKEKKIEHLYIGVQRRINAFFHQSLKPF